MSDEIRPEHIAAVGARDAFPVSNGVDTMPGMTLREYYAGQALQALLAAGRTGGVAWHAAFFADDLIAALIRLERERCPSDDSNDAGQDADR